MRWVVAIALVGLVAACVVTSTEGFRLSPGSKLAGLAKEFSAKGSAKYMIRSCGKICPKAAPTGCSASQCSTTASTYRFHVHHKFEEASNQWNFEGRVLIEGEGDATVRFYKSPNVVSGIMAASGFEQQACASIQQDDFFQRTPSDPIYIVDEKGPATLRARFNATATTNDVYSLSLGDTVFSVLAHRKPGQLLPSPTAYSKFDLYSKDMEITVDSFEPNVDTFQMPADVDFTMCNPFYLMPTGVKPAAPKHMAGNLTDWIRGVAEWLPKISALNKEGALSQSIQQLKSIRRPIKADPMQGAVLQPIGYIQQQQDSTATNYFYDSATAIVFRTKTRAGKTAKYMPSIATSKPIPSPGKISDMVQVAPANNAPTLKPANDNREAGDIDMRNVALVEELTMRADSSANVLLFKGTGVCTDAMKGDGYCDKDCNTAATQWDGGDCCRGTCVDKKYACGVNGFQCRQPTTRKCLFLHGLGQDGPASVGVFSTSQMARGHSELGIPWYWGDMATETEGLCGEIIYNWAQTNGRGWGDRALQDNYYNKAKEVRDAGGVVFAHSMGNPILAGACLDQNKCTKWHSLSGPYRGARAASVQDNLTFWNKDGGGLGSLVLTSRGNMLAATQRDALAQTVADKGLLLSALCGYDAWGSGGRTGAALWAARDLVAGTYYCSRTRKVLLIDVCVEWSTVEHDGLVGFLECAAYGRGANTFLNGNYQRNYQNKFYKFRGNHQDSTGARGNHDNFFDFVRYAIKTRPA